MDNFQKLVLFFAKINKYPYFTTNFKSVYIIFFKIQTIFLKISTIVKINNYFYNHNSWPKIMNYS